MKNIAKQLLSNNFFLPFAESRRCIFMYHDVSDEREKHFSAEHYSTTIDNFKKQIHFLSRKFEIVPLDTLVTDTNLSKKKHHASIVFDDGFFSVAETALKILSAEQIPFAVFVNKAAIEFDQLWFSNLILYKDDEAYLQKLFGYLADSPVSYEDFVSNPIRLIYENAKFDDNFKETYLYSQEGKEKKTYLDTEDVKYLHNGGVLIGSHSSDHYRLNKCTEAELSTQIDENKDFLNDLLNAKVEHFAIPFGKKEHYNEKVIEKIFAAEHKFVYSTNIVPFKAKEITKTEFLFPRIGILNESPKEIMFAVNRTFLKTYEL